MKAYELMTKISPEGKLELPDALQKALPRDEAVRVIILVGEASHDSESAAWARLTAEQFLSSYAEADAIYDRI